MRGPRSAATIALASAVCAGAASGAVHLKQPPEDLLAGEVMAVAYSGFREGQHLDRADGAVKGLRGSRQIEGER